ncbi:hypothetical protein Q669_12595 [Labrenzia sp. C1B10]|nr:hypothetical protein Q669_12595 [Labrenzia sp. C1B10]ERS07902.1 hypothetical protein Q675_21225 [Labrenzia sp. C1B70]
MLIKGGTTEAGKRPLISFFPVRTLAATAADRILR